VNAGFGLLFVAAGGLAGWAGMWRMRRSELQFLRLRDELSDTVIYETFYGDSGLPMGPVSDVWHEIADVHKLPAGKLRPSDRFGTDIGRWLITSEELDTLYEFGVRRAKRLGLKPKFEAITTVDDYVRALAIIPGE
jgi:hypothetical protein